MSRPLPLRLPPLPRRQLQIIDGAVCLDARPRVDASFVPMTQLMEEIEDSHLRDALEEGVMFIQATTLRLFKKVSMLPASSNTSNWSFIWRGPGEGQMISIYDHRILMNRPVALGPVFISSERGEIEGFAAEELFVLASM